MWISRDLEKFLAPHDALPCQVVWGPRQCGKSSLLSHLSEGWGEVTLDDLQSRSLAQRDPELFFAQNTPPVIIDEAQYAPDLFPQIKLIIDKMRRQSLLTNDQRQLMFRLTGSHQILLDQRIKESLAGRASYFRLHPLSLKEMRQSKINLDIHEVIFRGGWPELALNPKISAVDYLNDYIRTVIEKDLILSSGIDKINEFNNMLGLLAARVGELLNLNSLGNEAGVTGVTLKSWLGLLERSGLAGLLRPFHSNLNKRLVKTPKFYFFDTGLAVRLQGHLQSQLMFKTPSFGHLFENLVVSEAIKTRDHHRRAWNFYFWRTRDGEEYDLLIEAGNRMIVLDAQVAIQSAKPIEASPQLLKTLKNYQLDLIVCTYGGTKTKLSRHCTQVPVEQLGEYLLAEL
jgi:predicted AAA+ superfamily ATPase